MKIARNVVGLFLVLAASAVGWLYATSGTYGLNVVLRRGGSYWLPVSPDSSLLSPSMRLAFGETPTATPGNVTWKTVGPGFEVSTLSAIVDGHEVDQLLLARIDPKQYRFAVLNAPDGNKGLDKWMTDTGAVLVVNGSYYSQRGTPDTPFLSNGKLMGPSAYDAKAGAFVASSTFTGIRDLAQQDWKTVFQGADNAMVSYPLLVANGATHVTKPSQWLANRSFVGQDKSGRIIIGTTKEAFFTLDRFAKFLLSSPLDLDLALNLDGGPVACQAITLNSFERRTYGEWEMQAEGKQGKLLYWPYGQWAMPIVLAVLKRN